MIGAHAHRNFALMSLLEKNKVDIFSHEWGYDATDPDLSSFAKRGGKLILWHGLADPHISPLNTIAYYMAMNDVMGETETQKLVRLYLFPGG